MCSYALQPLCFVNVSMPSMAQFDKCGNTFMMLQQMQQLLQQQPIKHK